MRRFLEICFFLGQVVLNKIPFNVNKKIISNVLGEKSGYEYLKQIILLFSGKY
jgi:hypothetical protein